MVRAYCGIVSDRVVGAAGLGHSRAGQSEASSVYEAVNEEEHVHIERRRPQRTYKRSLLNSYKQESKHHFFFCPLFKTAFLFARRRLIGSLKTAGHQINM